MTRLSCQRDIHAIVSWLEQVDPTQVHEDFDYIPNHHFAKLVGVSPAYHRVLIALRPTGADHRK